MGSSDDRIMSIDSRASSSPGEEKTSRTRRPHLFARSLSRGSFSWSFVRSALQPSSNGRSVGALSPASTVSSCSCDDQFASRKGGSSISSSVSNVSDVSSDACSTSGATSPGTSGSSSSVSYSWRSKGKRKGRKLTAGERKPVLVEKIPFGKSSKYLTVHVGPRIEQSVKYVISRKLLTHPLFQLLLKCSEDEFGEDFAVDKGVAIVCDPALFLQVVRTVDDSLWNAMCF